jgi:pimeloyl-ACP methyl ester carboxylesterase
MPLFSRHGIEFHYREVGGGTPFVFQHGLGGDTSQPLGIFQPPPGFRLLTMDCRGHGETRPLGDMEKISIAAFADDVVALLDHLGVRRAVVGGISMGSAVALNIALRYPQRVLGLVLSRAAWLDEPLQSNVRIYTGLARLIRQYGAQRAAEVFRESEDYRSVRRVSPDTADSLLRQFQNARIEETIVKLERIAVDAPCRSLDPLKAIAVPTLVLASRQDPIHPYTYGEILARTIPGAEFRELSPKSIDKDRLAAEVQRFFADFLLRRCAPRE